MPPIAKQIQDTGVSEALDILAGPFGLRRFVVHFALVGTQVRIQGLEAVPLRIGGGPPPPDLSGEKMEALEELLSEDKDKRNSVLQKSASNGIMHTYSTHLIRITNAQHANSNGHG